MRNARAGFTMLEAVFATALSAVVLMGFFQLLSVQGRVASEEVQDTDAQTGVMRAMSNLLPLLQEARPLQNVAHTSFTANTFQFRVPLKAVDGTPFTRKSKSGYTQFQFGAGLPGSMVQGNYYEVTFLPGYDGGVGRTDERLLESAIQNDDGTLGADLNADGDKTDEFIFGTLLLRERQENGALLTETILGGRICVQTGGQAIFSYTYPTLTVTLQYADIRNKNGEYSRLRRTDSSATMRNDRPPADVDTVIKAENY